jgi:hypothetical protein
MWKSLLKLIVNSYGRYDFLNEILIGVSLKKGSSNDGSTSAMSFIVKYGKEWCVQPYIALIC